MSYDNRTIFSQIVDHRERQRDGSQDGFSDDNEMVLEEDIMEEFLESAQMHRPTDLAHSSLFESMMEGVTESNRSSIELNKAELITTQKVSNYAKFRKSQAVLDQVVEEVTSDVDSNQSNLSDLSYNSQDYQQSRPEKKKKTIRTVSMTAGVGDKFHESLVKEKALEVDDVFKIVTISEESFLRYAERKMQEAKSITMQTALSLTQQHKQTTVEVQRVLSYPKLMKHLTQTLIKRQSEFKATCLTVSEYSVIIGTSAGIIVVYDRDTEKFHSLYREESKDFRDNVVTCVDVHPLRPEYVVSGHIKGQLILLDLTKLPQSSKHVKMVKNHHSSSVVSVKFLDWFKERPHKDDKQAWMFCSVDIEGRVIVTKVQNAALGILTAEKIIVVGLKHNIQSIASRFFDKLNPKDDVNDKCTLVALGSTESVAIEIVEDKRSFRLFTLPRPQFYPSDNLQAITQFAKAVPVTCWGQGRTNKFNEQVYTILAVAWGPLIQLVVVLDVRTAKLVLDGYYFVATATEYRQMQDQQDPIVTSLHFIDESLLVATLSTTDIRVLYTAKFHEGNYEQPMPGQLITNFSTFDSRRKVVAYGNPLTKEQQAIELERRTYLDWQLLPSKFGNVGSQTVSVHSGRIVILCQDGSAYQLHHQSWEQILSKQQKKMQGHNWLDIFTKALEIYLGKVKGLRNVPDDDILRGHMLRGQLKIKISEILEHVILQWRKQASSELKLGKSKDSVQHELNRNLQALIRIIIELAVEIQEADFLFTDILQQFKDIGFGELFAQEIKPYILSGFFADWIAPEQVLNFHILQHHQAVFLEAFHGHNTSPPSGDSRHVSPAENFEKILISLRFDACSKTNITEMLEFCKRHRLATGALYLCVSTMGDKGPTKALTLLRDFYTEAAKEEEGRQSTTLAEIKQLVNIPANSSERVPLERSALYLGLKLLWATRLFIEGKKFPRGHFIKSQWATICQDILLLITQPQFMLTMTKIDASAFFRILCTPFNVNTQQHLWTQQSSQKIFANLQAFCLMLDRGHHVRTTFLCFIANIGTSQILKQHDRLFFFDSTLELLENSSQLVQFNEQVLKSDVVIQLSPKVASTSASNKAHVLSEEQLTQLMRKSEHLTVENINELVRSLEVTQFKHLKLIMYEKQEDYSKCLQMQLQYPMLDEQQDCFTWILKVFFMLQQRANHKDKFMQFQHEVTNSLQRLIEIDSHKTVGLCDAIFSSDHEGIINKLCESPKSQYAYIKKLIDLKGDKIKACIRAFVRDKQLELEQQAASWTRILSLHMRLTTKLEPSDVVPLVKLIARDSCYPLEDCLAVCRKNHQTEASAILCEEIGNYAESIKLYLQLLQETIVIKQLRKELYFTYSHTKTPKCEQLVMFESIFAKVDQIQLKHPEETLIQTDQVWQLVIQTISNLLNEPILANKSYCKRYFFERLQTSCRQLLGHVTFDHIISSYLKIQPQIRYSQLHTIVSEVFLDKKSEHTMCHTAFALIFIETKRLETSYLSDRARGLKFRSLKCALCSKKVAGTQVVVFECTRNYYNHSIHLECVTAVLKREQSKKATDVKMRCPVCFKSSYDIQGFQGDKKLFKLDQSQRPRENSSNSSSNSKVNINELPLMRNAQQIQQHKLEMRALDRSKKLKAFEGQIYDAVLKKTDFL